MGAHDLAEDSGDWPSGVYLGRLTTQPASADQPYWQNYVVFIVRDTRKADVLLQCSDNTWQAYNKWPDNTSLYTDPRGSQVRGVAASFDRPYGKYAQIYENPQSLGSGEWLCFEFPLAYWLEQHGYDVTYCSNSDCLDAAQLTRAKAFLSVGHDEYWDLRQYDAMKSAIAGGLNVLWLTGNAVFGVTPFTPASDGRANRVIERVGHFAGLTDAEVEQVRKVFSARLPARRPRRERDHRRAHRRALQRRWRLDLHAARPLDVRRHGPEERRPHPRPRRLGTPRCARENPRPRSRRRRPRVVRRRHAEPLHRDDFSRPEK
jgi:hypothetical protein